MTPTPTPRSADSLSPLASHYREVRQATEALCAPLSEEDLVVRTRREARPAKWHLGHTTWAFESAVLARAVPGYVPHHPRYEAVFAADSGRGPLTRPSLREVREYRAEVDRRVEELLARPQPAERAGQIREAMERGIDHELRHQERLLTDLKHAFWSNPLRPAYAPPRVAPLRKLRPMQWIEHPEGVREVGHSGAGPARADERPSHRVFLEAFALASRPVSNGEYLAFLDDGGYERPELWAPDGWRARRAGAWEAPEYWERQGDRWWVMSLSGMRELAYDQPVVHLGYWEAEAYARWTGGRLPREEEWEIAAEGLPVEGNFLEKGVLAPEAPAPRAAGRRPVQMYGDVWEWTASPHVAYPRARGLRLPVGRRVLRGGSCVTPRGAVRRTARLAFPPGARYLFAGLRLARDL